MRTKLAKADRLDVVRPSADPIQGTVIWFELDEADTRLLAKGLVSSVVRENAEAAIAWLEDEPSGFVDRTPAKAAV